MQRTGRAVLIGSSLGGLVAAWTAARDPARVAALVLIAPAFEVVRHLEVGRRLAAGETDTLELGPAAVADARRFDESRLPDHLTMPTLFIHGERDDTAPLADLLQLVDRDRVRVIAGADHFFEEHFEPLRDAVTASL